MTPEHSTLRNQIEYAADKAAEIDLRTISISKIAAYIRPELLDTLRRFDDLHIKSQAAAIESLIQLGLP